MLQTECRTISHSKFLTLSEPQNPRTGCIICISFLCEIGKQTFHFDITTHLFHASYKDLSLIGPRDIINVGCQ